jgi:CRISPR-associated endonuclease/helicase Cas3
MTNAKRYLAHVRRNDDGSFADHELEEHLRAVADLAGEFAPSFGHPDWGRLVGLWHDLGKYSWDFQSTMLVRTR